MGKKKSNRNVINGKGNVKQVSTKTYVMKMIRGVCLLVAVLGCAVANYKHQSSMFENDRHFSHLSTLEREMTFRSEMGFYYFFFKQIVGAESFVDGVRHMLNENRTEHPSTVNALRRFNVYPELLIGGTYRVFKWMMAYLNIQDQTCWMINRGDGLEPVESCEGLGDPINFYVRSIFAWNGLVSSLIFLFGYFLSGSVHGGIIATLNFFFNHGHCTRVQWTPPLRESLGYPIFLAQMLYTTCLLSRNQRWFKSQLPIILLNVIFMLSWQFAQFALLTQVFVIMIMFLLRIIHPEIAYRILRSHAIALLISFILLFGNMMLVTSVYASFLFASLATHHCHGFIVRITVPKLSIITGFFCILVHSVIITFGYFIFRFCFKHIFQVDDDNHIFDILKSKFSSFRTFHTLLYTCAPEFDFLTISTVLDLCKTLLVPVTLTVAIVVIINLVMNILRMKKGDDIDYEACVYNLLQLVAFTIMAALIMRLKLFFTPHLCIISSLMACRSLFGLFKPNVHFSIAVLLFSGMIYQGLPNVKHQQSIVGEYSNPTLEMALNWIQNETPKSAVFAGSMSTTANVLLSTGRAIVNHPHYENTEIRDRTKEVYQIFSRQSEEYIWRKLKRLKVDYFIYGKPWCSSEMVGCSISNIWDSIQPSLKNSAEPICRRSRLTHFKIVFNNELYAILKI